MTLFCASAKSWVHVAAYVGDTLVWEESLEACEHTSIPDPPSGDEDIYRVRITHEDGEQQEERWQQQTESNR